MARATQIARVLVDAPGLGPLDYGVPEDLFVAVGDLVLVPLGTRRVVGIVVELSGSSRFEGARLKRVQMVLRISRPLSLEWLELTRFASRYYMRG